EVTLERSVAGLDRVLAGQLAIQQRRMIDFHVCRSEKGVADYRALNDDVINKGTRSRMVVLEARVDGQYVSRFRADGLIVATPTGSTAYNLSAGGLIIFPIMGAMVVTPICSHTLTNRPIVLPAGAQIDVRLHSSQDEVYVTVDGQVGHTLQIDDRLTI